jgi:serine/threonine protein kinase/tetratricopeptide (TPR) repeat protein
MTLASGTLLGPYEIQSLLGAGGMGEVYRARDTRLNRFVGIKILREDASSNPDRLHRFKREALSASALNHPNIVTVYDVGQYGSSPFIAMELVEGKTLRQIVSAGAMPVRTLLNISMQLSEGLACAHEAGIVHRDLKPENVIVNKDGLVKILDFGLAKLSGLESFPENRSQIPTSEPETASGIIMGTIGYMSPEQASGEPADFRSDQFSLGTILYEMVTAHSPFYRKTAAETLVAIIREQPEPVESLNPEIPVLLARVIQRCLSKEKTERYGSTRDLVRDLRDVKEQGSTFQTAQPSSTTSTKTRPRFFLPANLLLFLSILAVLIWQFPFGRTKAPPVSSPQAASLAVLPFTSVGNETHEEYFSDGITEALITQIGQIEGIKVIARNSVLPYKGRNADIRQIGKELKVNYIVEGSVQRSTDRVRVNARLSNVGTGYQLWAERYDRNAADLFAVQDDISQKIGSALKLKLSAASTERRPPTQNLEAYDFYLRGKYSLKNVSEEDLNQAIPHLEKAIALDPQFALAHVALGQVYRQKYFFLEPRKEWEEKAFVEIEKGIALDPNLAEAYAARGRLLWTRQNNYPHERVAQDYKKAIALDPNLAEPHAYLAGIYHHVGLLNEAIQESKKALDLDPTNTLARSQRVMALLFDLEYQNALLASEQSPGDEVWVVLTLLYQGNVQESERRIKDLLQKGSERGSIVRVWDASFLHSSYAVLLAKTARAAEAEQHIRTAIEADVGLGHFHHTEYNIASAYALMGKGELALEWLTKADAHGFSCYPFFAKDPHLENLHGNPEFKTLLEKMKQQTEFYRREFLN